MPDSPVVTLVRWRRADTDPPEGDFIPGIGPKVTNIRTAYWRKSSREWCCEVDGAPLDPQPTWWCDPVPPGDDPLTMDNWESAVAELEGTGYEHDRVEAARLRRAIEEGSQEP